jgi:hypothetical protein
MPVVDGECYFGEGGDVNISRLRPGSGFGFGLGAFLVSFLPLSLFPMQASMTQKSAGEKPLGASTLQGASAELRMTGQVI